MDLFFRSWADEIKSVVHSCFQDKDLLAYAELAADPEICVARQKENCSKHADTTFILIGHRSWSLFVYCMPPYCYAGILSLDDGDVLRGFALMRFHWQNWSNSEAASMRSTDVSKVQMGQHRLHTCRGLIPPARSRHSCNSNLQSNRMPGSW